MENHRLERSKTANVLFAMMATVKTQMQSSFVMAVTWPFIRNVTEFHLSPKASGCVEDVSWQGVVFL
jgi:hypothetical protein